MAIPILSKFTQIFEECNYFSAHHVAATSLIAICERIGPDLTALHVLPKLKELFDELAFSQETSITSGSLERSLKRDFASVVPHGCFLSNSFYGAITGRPVFSKSSTSSEYNPAKLLLNGVGWSILQSQGNRSAKNLMPHKRKSDLNQDPVDRHVFGKHEPWHWFPSPGASRDGPDFLGRVGSLRDELPWKIRASVMHSICAHHGALRSLAVCQDECLFLQLELVQDSRELFRSGTCQESIVHLVIMAMRRRHNTTVMELYKSWPRYCFVWTTSFVCFGFGQKVVIKSSPSNGKSYSSYHNILLFDVMGQYKMEPFQFNGVISVVDFNNCRAIFQVLNDICVLSSHERVASCDGTVHVRNSQTAYSAHVWKLISIFAESSANSAHVASPSTSTSKINTNQPNMLNSNQLLSGIFSTSFDGSLYTCMHHLEFIEKLVVGTGNGSLRFIDFTRGQKLHIWRSESGESSFPSLIYAICACGSNKMEADGAVASPSWIAAGLSSGICRLIDVRSGNIISSWRAHDAYVTKLAATDEHLLISSSLDRTLRVWDLRRNLPSHPIVFRGHSDTVSSFSMWRQDVISIAKNKIGLSSLARFADEDVGFLNLIISSSVNYISPIHLPLKNIICGKWIF
ncbi:hypothetical protein ACSBR2_019971 [Camellia fascicularis]